MKIQLKMNKTFALNSHPELVEGCHPEFIEGPPFAFYFRHSVSIALGMDPESQPANSSSHYQLLNI